MCCRPSNSQPTIAKKLNLNTERHDQKKEKKHYEQTANRHLNAADRNKWVRKKDAKNLQEHLP